MLHKFKFYLFSSETYYSVGTKILSVLEKYDERELDLFNIRTKLIHPLTCLKEYKNIVKNNKDIANSIYFDLCRDNAWMCLYYYILSCSKRKDKKLSERAYELLILLDNPNFQLKDLEYNKLNKSINKFFSIIDNNVDYLLNLKKIKAFDYYLELKRFHQLHSNIISQLKRKEDQNLTTQILRSTRQIRLGITKLSTFLEIMHGMSRKIEYSEIAKDINKIIDHTNRYNKKRRKIELRTEN